MSDDLTFLARGLHWPKDIKETAISHAFRHVTGMDLAVSMCPRRRRVVQAGGNIGLWPRRLAKSFAKVDTFEPEPLTYSCLSRNVAEFPNITARNMALGEAPGHAKIVRESLASHHLEAGEGTKVDTLDSFGFDDVDLIQLDVEGYELNALRGGEQTIRRCRPVIQLEMRGFSTAYGSSDEAIRSFLGGLGYKQAAELVGSDFVFAPNELTIRTTPASLMATARLRVRNLLRGLKGQGAASQPAHH